jgi:hypothetical protein
VRRGIWDKLEVLLHGFVAAVCTKEVGGRMEGRERARNPASQQACNATFVAPTKKMNRRHKNFFSCAIKIYFRPIKYILFSSLQ